MYIQKENDGSGGNLNTDIRIEVLRKGPMKIRLNVFNKPKGYQKVGNQEGRDKQ